MRQIDFNHLPRSTRERFVRSLVSDAPGSAPICSRTSASGNPTLWYVLLAVASIGLGVLALPTFGSPFAPVQDRRWLGGYVGLCAMLGLALASLARRQALAGALPFVPGIYVFPLDLVDARKREIELYPIAELVSIEPVHHHRGINYTHSTLWFVFSSQSFTIEVRGRELADAQVARINEARQDITAATHRGQLYELASLDPFAEARERNFEPAFDHGLLARDSPIWTRFVWAITIVSGLVLGVAAWRGRNWQSDERAFAELEAKPDAQLARTYLSGGGLRAADVKNTILPRAQLAEAMKETGAKRAEGLDQLLKDHPRSSVDKEARAALAEAMHVYYMSQTTVVGLRAFVARWPDSPDVLTARTKIHELFQSTLSDFRKHANVTDKHVLPVVEALLAWVENRGTALEVRFRRRSATSLASIDKLLAKNLLDDGGPSKGGNAPVWTHFGPGGIALREAVLVAGLERGLRRVFPADVLPLRLGTSLDDATMQSKPGPPLAEVQAPTIVVDYEIGWAGTTYVARDRLRRFLGVFVKVDVAVQVPKESRVLAFALKVEPPESFPVEDRFAAAEATRDDEHVYDLMLLRAFDHVSAKLMAVFFEPRTAATRAPEPL